MTLCHSPNLKSVNIISKINLVYIIQTNKKSHCAEDQGVNHITIFFLFIFDKNIFIIFIWYGNLVESKWAVPV